MLGRDTPWRQGSIINNDFAAALDLVASGDTTQIPILISHDCDLANDNEPEVEFIVGQVLSSSEPTYQRARNARKLHVKVALGTSECWLELTYANRREVSRNDFNAHCRGDADVPLCQQDRQALQQWLAARYGRPAFPNKFEEYLRKPFNSKLNVERKLNKILEQCSSHLVGVFFDLGDHWEKDLPEGEPYELNITIAYDSIEGVAEARQAAEGAASEIESVFRTVFGAPDAAKEIALENCTAVSDTLVTLADLRRIKQWRAEWISLNEEPAGDFISHGTIPS